MCDTLVIRAGDATWFAKNSDREPEEPQVIEVHAPVHGDRAATVRATYIDVPQVPDRHGTILSRPVWIWGAEMGVNDQGVAIGNEAVFSKRVDKTGQSLLGMDLLRFGLERGENAREALDVITGLLETYGQAGPAGYQNKKARYDNSFLITDAQEAWVLETAGKSWAAKKVNRYYAISNTYSLRDQYDLHSADLPEGTDFKKKFERVVMPYLARGKDRSALSESKICAVPPEELKLSNVANMLRAHFKGNGFDQPSRANVCMHARGFTCPSQSTASLVAKLVPGEPPRVAATGTPLPCISLFKPVTFDPDETWVVSDRLANDPATLWHQGDNLAKRAAAEPALAEHLRRSIAASEPETLDAVERGDPEAADALARLWLDKQIRMLATAA